MSNATMITVGNTFSKIRHWIMKKLMILVFLCPTILYAQKDLEANEQPKYSLYVEFGGNGFAISGNYERIIYLDEKWKLMPRVGFMAIPAFGELQVAFPLELSLVTKLEIGLGITPRSDGLVPLFFRLGYRSVNENGFLFRIAFTPMVFDSELRPWEV